jgi:lipopolysaccharide/colanic/teichoic acid biosynthesis glycosyltransferase
MKRIFDIFFSGLVLLLVSPLFIPIIIVLLITGEHKVFYKQTRIGKGKKEFGLLKFVTMLSNSSNMTGGDVTLKNDPRVLPAGRFLRKSKLNELPQLLNILFGDMSIVGPRPMTGRNFEYYSEEIQNCIASIKPGLTGIGSIVFRDEEKYIDNTEKPALDFFKEDIAPFKGELEKWYAERANLGLDLKLIFMTIYVIFFPNSNIVTKTFTDLPRHKLFLP